MKPSGFFCPNLAIEYCTFVKNKRDYAKSTTDDFVSGTAEGDGAVDVEGSSHGSAGDGLQRARRGAEDGAAEAVLFPCDHHQGRGYSRHGHLPEGVLWGERWQPAHGAVHGVAADTPHQGLPGDGGERHAGDHALVLLT